jgi:hypothetical protein
MGLRLLDGKLRTKVPEYPLQLVWQPHGVEAAGWGVED